MAVDNILKCLNENDQLREIEKMSVEDNGYRKQEWISVEERLPEKFETVLVFCDTGARKFQCVSEMIEPNGKRWSAVCGFRVTHWMPLPEAPKKGGETDA